MSGFTIRQAGESDVAFLVDVVVETMRPDERWPVGSDESEFRRGYSAWMTAQVCGADPSSLTSVIESAGEPIGRLRVERTEDGIELSGIQIRPGLQSRGIGTSIIEELQREAATANVSFFLNVGHNNPRARSLYERLGFVYVGEAGKEARLRWVP